MPVNALIQNRPSPEHKGRVIGAANLLSFGGIALAATRAVRDVAIGAPRRGARVLHLRSGMRADGDCVGSDATGIVAKRAVLDAAEAEG